MHAKKQAGKVLLDLFSFVGNKLLRHWQGMCLELPQKLITADVWRGGRQIRLLLLASA